MQKVLPNRLRMFKKISFALAAIFVFTILSFILSACGSASLSLPDADSDIWGNGGSVVKMGEYTYFADGYVKSSEVKSKNEKTATLYRIKDGEDVPEKIASRVVGFEGANLFIYGDYLFYVTPCQNTETTGVLRNDQITIMRTGLDGRGAKELYSSKSFVHSETTGSSKNTVGFMVVDGNPYILIYEGKKIVRLDKNGKEFILAEEADSAAFSTAVNMAGNQYEASEFERYVYFTKARNAKQIGDFGQSGNVLYKRDITNTSDDEKANLELYIRPAVTVENLMVSNGWLIYTHDIEFTGTKALYKSNGIIGHEVELFQPVSVLTDYMIITGDRGHGVSEIGFLFYSNNKIFYKPLQEDGKYLNDFNEIDSASKILFAQNAFVYYLKDNEVWRAKADNTSIAPEKIDLSGWNASTAEVQRFDMDNQYFYFQGTIKYHEDDTTETISRDTKNHTYRLTLTSISTAADGGKLDAKLFWEYVPKLDD